MKAAFVVPRYGPTVVGGAETGARLLAEGLAGRKGWEVEVLTTCAEDFTTWDDVLVPGRETVNGVVVTRFVSSAGRDPSFHPFSARLLAEPARASLADAERWIDLQGPVVPALTDAVTVTPSPAGAAGTAADAAGAASDSGADVVIFYPYLYYPTVRAIDRVGVPTVLHPAAHDEPALRLPVFPRVFESADALVFQTVAERELVQRTFPVASHPQLLLGLGVDDPDRLATGSPRGDRRSRGDGPPFLLCLGRVDRHKGSLLLASLFAAYKRRHPGSLRLVFAGPVVEGPAPHPDIDVVGPVSEVEKWALLEDAVALVSPSVYEAFSLAVAESWSARTPVVVNATCGATVEHCSRSGGGIPFGGFAEFEAAVELLAGDAATRRALGERGRAYVDRWYRWPQVVDRYARFLERVAAA